MKIDLRAKELPANCKVWRAFPGKRYGLLEAFTENNAVFLEYADLSITENVDDDPNLAAKVYTAQALAELKREGGPNARPRSRWQDNAGVHVDQVLGRRISSVVQLFKDANKGDIVVVPSRMGNDVIKLGVFDTEPNERLSIESPGIFNRYVFPARSVKWLTDTNETLFSTALSRSLRHEQPFSDIGEPLYNEVFSLAYGNFIGNNIYSSVVLNGDYDFTDSDNAFVGVIFTLAAYACEAYENGQDTFKIDDIFDFIANRPPIEYACLFASKHNSPGFTRYLGEKGTALVAAAIIAGLIALPTDASAAQIQQIARQTEFVNSLAANGNACDPNILGPAQILFRSIGGDKLRKACHTMQETTDRAKLGVRSRSVRDGRRR